MKEIKLTRNQIALVDDEDFDRLSQFKWHVSKTGFKKENYTWYAVRTKVTTKHETIFMHREVLGLTGKPERIDHADHNGLNNQKSNLRIATLSQNQANRRLLPNNKTGFKGVSVIRKGYRSHHALFK